LKYFMTAFSPFVKYVSLAFGHICGKSAYEELKNTIFSVSFLYYFPILCGWLDTMFMEYVL
jgi:hypothetical protein